MRIAIFSDFFYPELSGVADSILTTAQELAARGHQVNFCVPKYSESNYLVAKRDKNLLLNKNISVIRFASLPLRSATKQSRMVVASGFRWIFSHKFKPDLIHVQTFGGVGLEGLIESKIFGIPLIGTNHNPVKEYMRFTALKNEAAVWTAGKYNAWFFNRCDFVTAPSPGVIDAMKEDGFNRPYQVVSNPIDSATFSPAPDKQSLKKELGLPERVFVSVGRLSPEKCVDVIINSLPKIKESFPDFILAIAGHGDEEDKLKALATSLGVSENVRFFGTLGRAELAKLYQSADFYVTASVAETQNLTLIQAMSCGLPCIGTAIPAHKDNLNESNGFLIEPGNSEQIAAAAVKIFQDPALKSRLGQNALTTVKKYSVSSIADQWEEIYSKVLQKRF